MLKKVFVVLLCFSMLFGIAACGNQVSEAPSTSSEQPSANGEDLPILRVAVMPSYYSACMSYISEQGWDVEEGFKIELISFTSGAPMNEALAAGLWDVAGIGTAGVHALAQYDAKLIAEIQDAAALDIVVRGDSDIAGVTTTNSDGIEVLGNAETVKGKTLLCPAGTVGQYYAGKWLEDLGLTLSDVNFVHMEFPQAYQAFQTGEGDIACLRMPDWYFGEKNLGFKSIGKMQDISPMHEFLICSNDCYENNRELLKKFVALQFRAQEEILADDELAIKVLRSWYDTCGYETSDEAVAAEVSLHTFLTAEDAGKTSFGETFTVAAEFMIEQGQLEADKLDTVKSNYAPDVLVELGYRES